MQGQLREALGDSSNRFPWNEVWSLSKALSSTRFSRSLTFETKADANCQQFCGLAEFSPRHAEEIRMLRATQAQSRHKRALLEWAAQISTQAETNLRALQIEETSEHRTEKHAERLPRAQPERSETQPSARSHQTSSAELIEWDPDQPRQPKGTSRGGQWAAHGGDGLLGSVIRRNQLVADLTGETTPNLIRSSRLAMDLQTASQNGVNLENGLKVVGSALGLAANVKAARELSRAASAAQLAKVEAYIAKCPRELTPTKSAANQYEIAHTGPYNYTVSGGGAQFDIDGY